MLRCAQPVFFAAVVLLGAVPGTGALVASVALYGVAMGVVEAAMNAQAVAIERHAGRSLVNGFFAVWSGASIAGSLWVSFANGADLSLAVGFAVPAAIGLLIAVATVRLPLRKDAERAIAQAAEQRAARRLRAAGGPAVSVPWRPLLVLGAALACAYVAEGAIAGFAVKYVRDELGGADTVAPWPSRRSRPRRSRDGRSPTWWCAAGARPGSSAAAPCWPRSAWSPPSSRRPRGSPSPGSRAPESGCARSRPERTPPRPATTRSGRASRSRGSASSTTSAPWPGRGWSPCWPRCPGTGRATWWRPFWFW
ncbi:MFS transporter [Actinomadura keratinilytica]|uniref:hypothetical protein n=1 Tax=Actinomadura keratinilytica TaxID=547461 RepID=UPI0036148C6C